MLNQNIDDYIANFEQYIKTPPNLLTTRNEQFQALMSESNLLKSPQGKHLKSDPILY